ncbi:hypothetical protein A9Q84_17795 [Halobacteriovorax marinus]|uniref:Aminotransferase class I/classII large domain-containing protein n=1 Tax=Halobacteriovorax marinus TaxID=97084 RepID=A0A1Y5F765_9BACT|nr:hypothetical protein A9Q84_17795 [Halobacteriovorax marinus]
MKNFQSKLPSVGETIFSTISAKAQQFQAINLGQGFPDYDGDEFLKDRICHYIKSAHNQYAPMPGVLALRESIADYFKNKYQLNLSPNSEITITSGATEALTASILGLVSQDEEVIIFDPSYDSYAPAIQLAGARAVRLNLVDETFALPMEQLKKSINTKTRMIILNSPHNPTGAILSRETWLEISELVAGTDIIILSDEVYEGIHFIGERHFSPLELPDLKERLISVFSFGKSCHMTGWKIGYAIASPFLTTELRKLHQYFTFSTFTAAQLALADYLREHQENFINLGSFYNTKKELFIKELTGSRFKVLDSSGTYFLLVDYSEISNKIDTEFCLELIEKYGVASIPISVFYEKPISDQRIIRFCFAKKDETIKKACKILREI